MTKQKLQIITLKGGAEVLADWATMTSCKSCGMKIYWAKTKNEKQMPINVCGVAEWESHFASCPNANTHRKNGKE